MFLIELHSLELHTVVSFQKTDEVRSISWSRNDDLFFSWGSPALGVWTEESIGAVNPAYAKPFKISTIQASQDNSIIMLKGGKSICLYYPDLFSRNKNIPDFIGKSIIASQRVSQVSASFYKGDRSQNDSINLRRVEVDTTRKSHEIPTKDLMDMYDRKKTPEKGGNDREYDSNETFGRRDDDYEYQRKHKFEY